MAVEVNVLFFMLALAHLSIKDTGLTSKIASNFKILMLLTSFSQGQEFLLPFVVWSHFALTQQGGVFWKQGGEVFKWRICTS